MQKDEWRQSLKHLHTALKNAECVDRKSKERVDKLMDDIERILEHPEGIGPEHRSLAESLSASAEHFELSHPTLTGLISNVANTLKNIGI